MGKGQKKKGRREAARGEKQSPDGNFLVGVVKAWKMSTMNRSILPIE